MQHVWSDLEAETHFGFNWGGAQYVHVPDGKFDGLAIVLPARRDATVFEVYLGLRVEAMVLFEKDEEWCSFAP